MEVTLTDSSYVNHYTGSGSIRLPSVSGSWRKEMTPVANSGNQMLYEGTFSATYVP